MKFAYNGNGEVANISNGGRTWSYAYSSNGKLNNVTDPIGRLTQYHYWSGNPWLIQNIIYPTGGKTGYVYGNSPAGINVLTYYATQQNAYAKNSSSSLTNSTSFSYRILNGLIQWVNTTTATGSGVEQNNLNFSYSGAVEQQVSIKNASSQTIVNDQSNFDTLYRENESKELSSTNGQISLASVKYDNWGNVVFTEDPMGHEA